MKEIRVKSKDTLYLIFPDMTNELLERMSSKASVGRTIFLDKEPIIIIKENNNESGND